MRQWFYARAGQQQGPVPEDSLVKMFESGDLPPDTQVWSEGLEDWVAARDVVGLVPASRTATSFPQPAGAPSVPGWEPTGPQARPWVRYWARTLDFLLFCFVMGTVLGIAYPPALEMPGAALGLVLQLAYLFVEPAMFVAWGTTPGKGLLRVRVRNSDGSRLSYSAALGRTFKVWVRGEGLGIPLVALITQISAYNRLSKQGITSWDRDGNFSVTHRVIGAWRIVAGFLIFAALAILSVIGEMS